MLHRIYFLISSIFERQIFPEIVQLSSLHEMKLNFFSRNEEHGKLNKLSVGECYMHLITLIQMFTHFFTVCSSWWRGLYVLTYAVPSINRWAWRPQRKSIQKSFV